MSFTSSHVAYFGLLVAGWFNTRVFHALARGPMTVLPIGFLIILCCHGCKWFQISYQVWFWFSSLGSY